MLRVSAAYEPYPTPNVIFDWLDEQFGMDPSVFDEFQLWHRPGINSIWLASKSVLITPEIKAETVGIQVTRRPPPRAKPSTYFAQRFGRHAQRNVVTLREIDIEPFFRGEFIDATLPPGPPRNCIVRVGDISLGCGWASRGQVRSQLPSHWRAESPGGIPVGLELEFDSGR